MSYNPRAKCVKCRDDNCDEHETQFSAMHEALKAVANMHCMPTEGALTYRDTTGAMLLVRKALKLAGRSAA